MYNNLGTALISPYDGANKSSQLGCYYTAAQLTAAGLVANRPITTLGWNVVNKNSTGAFANFSIQLANVAANPTTGTALPTGRITVYSNAAGVTTASGLNTYTLTAPFSWDGTSGLYVLTCFSNTSTSFMDKVDAINNANGCHFTASNSFSVCGASNNNAGFGQLPGLRFTQAGAYTLPAAPGTAGQVLTQQADGSVDFTNPQWTQSGTSLYPQALTSNIGIGTATPSQKLDVVGNATISGNTTVGGNVGIGTVSPASKLDVPSGTVRLPGGGGGDTWFNYSGDGKNYLRGTTALADLGGGRVGIGTSTPSQVLDVVGNTTISGTAAVGGLLTAGSATVTGNATVGGRVGIGTSTPSQALDVVGNATISGTAAVGGLLTAGSATVSGSVGIGTATPNASALLDVSSTTKGFLPPRMSQTQRDAINPAATAAGLTVFNTTTNATSVWNGTQWEDAIATGTPLPDVLFKLVVK